eukprot:jgi/Tetstr1/446087/TSEL_033688.t1
MEDQQRHEGSSPLFAIFVLSLLVLFAVPYSLYRACAGSDDAATHKAWAKDGKQQQKKKSAAQRLKGAFSGGNLVLLLAWGAILALLLYIQAAQQELAPFDPYSIMQLSPDATEKDVKRQYRDLARIYHPDKNPDPKAAEYFDLLVKAYKALTDDTARENYKKYGHPDGPQAMNIGVAMPSFLFTADKKTAPLMLLGLVGFGILLPLVVAACYLTRSNKYAGPNQVQHETLGLWFTHPKFGVKESQGLRRVPDTLVVAKEFIDMPVPSEQGPALEELKKLVTRHHADLKDIKKDFWKRKSSIIKAHMLLLAHLERAGEEVPPALEADLRFVLQRAPKLLAELMNVAVYPRKQHYLYGWMCPAVAVVEMMQCLTQAVSIRIRKPALAGNAKADKGGEAAAAMAQLPGMDSDVAKKLGRKKVKSLPDLAALPEGERSALLSSAGYSAEQVAEANTFLAAMPTVSAEVTFDVDGQSSVMEGDMVVATVRTVLTRPSHKTTPFDVDVERVKEVEAFAPSYPFPREERWYFLLCEASKNLLMAHDVAVLLEAEKAGAAQPELANGLPEAPAKAIEAAPMAAGSSQAEQSDIEEDGEEEEDVTALAAKGASPDGDVDPRQKVQLRFMAPEAGKYSLQLNIMSNCWIGCDKVVTAPLVVEKLNASEREAREAAKYDKPFDDSDVSEDEYHGEGEEEEELSDDDYSYDSDETGTDVSGDEGAPVEEEEDDDSDADVPELMEANGEVVESKKSK